MATEETPVIPENPADETSHGTTEGTEGKQPQSTPDAPETGADPIRLPDSHPLVKTLAAQAQEIKDLKGSHSEKVSSLETQVADLTAKAEAATALQTRYDRLEEFLTKVGGPLSKAMDSKSFTTALFETDKPVDDLVASWNQNNPSETTIALGSKGNAPDKKPSIGDLLRAAAK